MKPVSQTAVKKLDFSKAIQLEVKSQRNLLPPEPGWDSLESDAGIISSYCANLLKRGYHPTPEVEVSARKPGHGVRPVPYWGMLERIIYRALTEELLKSQPQLDRSPEAYLRFVTAPVFYARELQLQQKPGNSKSSLFTYINSPVKYVVKSDITAFYQFIDHAVLAEELLFIGADFELIEALFELLSEVQGRNFGIPQLFDASDALSEIYIDRVERDLLRNGLATWRFNDDFRIACEDYSDALAAIEALDRAARNSGLVISENKTVTVGFVNYMFDTLGKERTDVGETISIDEVEDVIGDYTDDFGEEDTDFAVSVLDRTRSKGADNEIDLRSIRLEDVRILRRALNGLAKSEDPRGIDYVLELSVYIPSLTPSIMRYLARIADSHLDAVSEILDKFMHEVPKNAWQRIWLIDSMRALQIISNDSDAGRGRIGWVMEIRRSTSDSLLQATASRALASAGILEPIEVISQLNNAPGALLSVYARAVREAFTHIRTETNSTAQKQIQALAKSSQLHRILLKDSE